MNRELFVLSLLSVAVISSALAVVYAKHLQRKSWMAIEVEQQQQAELDIEWARLQLEESAVATDGVVEKIARERLAMRLPAPEEVRVVSP
ncbi:MAG: cell division protein FtsL [Gammaproteobacteria bacterium]